MSRLSRAAAPLATLATLASVARLHIVVIGALGTLTFGWIFSGTRPVLLALCAALDWFIVNLLNRAVDLEEDRANQIRGTDLVARHRRAVLAVGLATLGASLALSLALVPAVVPWRLAFHLLGFAYNWRWLPGRRRLKQLYFWKNTASATGFLLTVFAYPLAARGALGDPGRLAAGISPATVGVAAGFFFLFELSYEVIYDLRDAPGDALAGLRTYPVVHGPRVAVLIVDGLLVGAVALLGGGYLAGVVPWRLAVMAVGPLVQLALYKRALRRGITSRDCVTLTWAGAALLASYHAWIALGLPGVTS